jgi:hypothetical protein
MKKLISALVCAMVLLSSSAYAEGHGTAFASASAGDSGNSGDGGPSDAEGGGDAGPQPARIIEIPENARVLVSFAQDGLKPAVIEEITLRERPKFSVLLMLRVALERNFGGRYYTEARIGVNGETEGVKFIRVPK